MRSAEFVAERVLVIATPSIFIFPQLVKLSLTDSELSLGTFHHFG